MSKPEDFEMVTKEMQDLYQAARYAEALEVIEKKALGYPEQTARVTFWRICLLSRCNRCQDALATLADGLNKHLWWHESQFLDADLDPTRELPGFKDLVDRSKKYWEEARAEMKPERTLLVPAGSGPYPLLIVLHGYSGNKDNDLKYWEMATRKGWMVLSPQSRQPLYPGAFYWETPQSGIEEILFHLSEIRSEYPIDAARIIVGGISQGAGMAILAALSPQLVAIASISVATWWENLDDIKAAVQHGKGIRSYFIVGLKDHILERSREIQSVLKDGGIPIKEEVHPDLGHEFPPDFEKSLENALNYLLP